jgi:hypothetical protein
VEAVKKGMDSESSFYMVTTNNLQRDLVSSETDGVFKMPATSNLIGSNSNQFIAV